MYAIFSEELLQYVILSMLSVNYPLFNCISKTPLKMGYGLFGGLKNIEVIISN